MRLKLLIALILIGLAIGIGALNLFQNKKEETTATINESSSVSQESSLCDLQSPNPSPIAREPYEKYVACRPIAIFLKDNTNDETVNQFLKELESTAGVRFAEYVSKEQAFENYKIQNKAEPLLTENVSKDNFPASITVNILDPGEKEKIQNLAKSKSFVSDAL